MEHEIADRAKKDEQDILWEELEEQFENIRKAFRKGQINLNQVVIEKSALYLKVDKYIDNVRDRTGVRDREAEKKLRQRHMRRYKNNKVADLDTIRLATSVDEFLMNDTAIGNQHMSKKYRSNAIEIDEEIKIPDSDMTENNMSNNFMLNFQKFGVKAQGNMEQDEEREESEIMSPVKFNSLKLRDYENKALDDNDLEINSSSCIQLLKNNRRKYTEADTNPFSVESKTHKPLEGAFTRKSIGEHFESSIEAPAGHSDDSDGTDAKQLEYYREVRKMSMRIKSKGTGNKVKIGMM